MPEGGCKKKCNIRMECGHQCPLHCHVTEHTRNMCIAICEKERPCGHICKLLCRKDCGDCFEQVKRSLLCGHN
jgi:hypothetical protein